MSDPPEELERLRARVAQLEADLAAARQGRIDHDLVRREVAALDQTASAKLGIYIWDLPTDDLYWSDEMFRIHGLDPAVDKASLERFFEAVHPDDKPLMAAATEEVAETGQPRTMDYRLQLEDGRVRHMTGGGTALLDETGQMRRMIGAVLDVTERHEVRQELERTAALLHAAQRVAHVGSWFWDLTDDVVEVSAELRRILGYSDDLVPTAATFLDRVHAGDKERVAEAMTVASQGVVPPSVDIRIVPADDAVRHVVINSAPIEDGDTVVAVLGTVMDVTDRFRLTEQLRQAQKLEGVGLLAGGLAHDFNNTLAVILGNATLLAERVDAEELDDIIEAATSASSLTRQLLSFSRATPLSPRTHDLNAIVQRTSSILGRLLGDHILLDLQLLSTPVWVELDSGLVEQVLLNLANNASDAMPDGGRLTIAVLSESATAAGLRVQDTGQGMDPGTMSRIFEPFFTTKSASQGTGLGLPMVADAIDRCGGSVTVESTRGEGTRFSIVLPRAAGADIEAAADPLSRPPAEPSRLMLVEDEEAVRRMLKLTLTRAGYDIQAFPTANAALAVLDGLPAGAQLPVRAIISDVTMPGLSGPEFLERVRQRWPSVPCLFISGFSHGYSDLDRAEGVSFLAKPFQPSELLNQVAELVTSS